MFKATGLNWCKVARRKLATERNPRHGMAGPAPVVANDWSAVSDLVK